MTLIWTRRAIADVQAIKQFIAQDSPHAAQLVAQRLVAAVDRLTLFPESGRIVPELADPQIREVVQGSYRIVYRLLGQQAHILTVHHSARLFPLGQ
ncbi:MAG: type II toxin-antitoxin system RelE/ParE family toxin [Thermomicrobiales bacterium]|uniref:Toxin RelE2 n=1 Tax=Nitrospira defluvii TaxID=330214 RepID=A0ABM8QIC7_9BACT|nr:type II toxin-antitoxin system RelE/ParE family toxin [Nitrospira defluvii]MCS6326616.1 type II toxin-antitoxin system RelE/ParE family toxin [Nitrospira sp.]TXG79343.1 MAG: type II toxin-antitoxin system RelE/ParE family toxin [Thermomicrobiales bacterium]CAE6698886.1 Toxin RelE2 [Nitrospira defluvii]